MLNSEHWWHDSTRGQFLAISLQLFVSQSPGKVFSRQIAHSVEQFVQFLWFRQPIKNKLEMEPKFKQVFFHFSFFLLCPRVHFVGVKKRKGVGRRKGSAHMPKMCRKLDFCPLCNSWLQLARTLKWWRHKVKTTRECLIVRPDCEREKIVKLFILIL